MMVQLSDAILTNTKVEVFMSMAHAIALLSKDAETQVGAVLISPTGRQIASGYNGFVRGAMDEDLPNTRPEKYEFMQHAERNVLYNCLDEGIKTRGCALICTLSPCLGCLRACYQSGITHIIFDRLYQESTDFYKQLKDIYVQIEYDTNTGFTYLSMSSPTMGRMWDANYKDWYDNN